MVILAHLRAWIRFHLQLKTISYGGHVNITCWESSDVSLMVKFTTRYVPTVIFHNYQSGNR